MESTVTLKLDIDGQIKSLANIPINYEELLKAITKETGMFNFNVKFGEHLINNSKDLVLAYLNNKADILTFTIDENMPNLAHMSSSDQMLMQSMMEKFGMGSTEEPEEKLPVEGGALRKEDLLRVIHAMTEHAKLKLLENMDRFQTKRQDFYGIDDEQYKQTVLEQLQFQEMLILSSTQEIVAKYGISPQVFSESCNKHSNDSTVREALENMAVDSLQASGEVPEALTKEELKNVLTYSCNFINEYINSHPDLNPVDIIILKMREADEVMKQFGYTELNIAGALTKYNIDSDPYFEDIRNMLGEVTQRLFKFQGGFPGMGGPPF